MRTMAAAVALVGLVTPSPVVAWGFETHKFIVSRAIDVLPDELRPFFQANRVFVVEHCIDPDLYPFSSLPRDYDAAVAKFGQETVSARGLLPWRAWEISGNLGRAFQRHQRGVGSAAGDVKFFAAIIGHYAADAHVPLQRRSADGADHRFRLDSEQRILLGPGATRRREHLALRPPPRGSCRSPP